MAPEVVYDLRRFAELLPESHQNLRKRLRRWIDAHSISTDLRLAHDCVESALRLSSTGRDSLDLAVMALMQSAVMAYARSLERKSHHRGTVAIKARFSPDQLDMHAKLCDLRDEAVAHFGPAGADEPWSEDFALLLQSGIHWQPVISSRRSLFRRTFAEAFLAHLLAAEALVVEIVERRRSEFQDLFGERIQQDEVADALEESALSSRDVSALQAVLNTPRAGRHVVKS